VYHLDAKKVVHHGVSKRVPNKSGDQDEKDEADFHPKEEADLPRVKAAVQEEVDAQGGDDEIGGTLTDGVAQAAVVVTLL